ncbi:MAG TPA: hypothetical protein VHD87_04610 [Acidimicrobiales bacterium]|nr:hypothetical protein [Acidimicrobiales bacterium]
MATAAVLFGANTMSSAGPGDITLTPVPTANTRSDGYAPASKLSKELRQIVQAQGATRVENPGALTSYYGYDNDVLNGAGDPQMVPTPATATEATKTEPDKNTYLVFGNGLTGASPSFDYGSHFLFQGHELGVSGQGYLTRVNLDADAEHRVTVLATSDSAGNPLATIDGSTWDPFAKRLLLTTESASKPTYAATPDYPSVVKDVSGALGRGGYEGIQDDKDGNIWIVEDIGGSTKPSTTAKIPNSFLYRYVPASPGDLKNGKLEVLQVRNASDQPITKASQTPLNSADQLALHVYGSSFTTHWVTIHDTAVDGTTPFNANTAAVTHDGTPFKRPENGNFRPDGTFTQFVFDETGDTNATSPENDNAGGWGSLWKLTQASPSADTGTLSILYKGDQTHAGFDNTTFVSQNQLAVVEDAGDTLHGQRNALDSGWLFDVTANYASTGVAPIRWLAEGRDASATLDAANGGFGHNEGDNEITGVVVSNGDRSPKGILGAKTPTPFSDGWRWFYTQQHGDNFTLEVVPAPTGA